ncbi:dTMP kinase [Bauldia litoralis]|uniref:Thymidylate kinase n=3 Tax=Bauldia litoralis TaxID=665467 RepID=A0A1G6AZN0_9HYPH|nr:dTMP kinase [Bauldia litoralis]SDB13830.1 dTMP kinase [Bauldia litoralis]
MAGKFITFEGGDGAGKSTQLRLLVARLAGEGIAAVVTREPGGTPTAETIRKVLLSGRVKSLGAEAEALLFAAARADHVDRLIRPALAAGEWVLCDRFFDSTRVYQGAIGGVDAGQLDALERVAVGRSRPDLTLMLDVPAEVGLSRVKARLEESGGVPDRFESDEIDLQQRRRQAFLDIAAANPGRCVIIDANRDEAAVAEDIWRAVESRLIKQAA